MNGVIQFDGLRDLIVEIRGQDMLLDCDVAALYGVATRDINKSVSNNRAKFPAGYIVELTDDEKKELVEKCHRFARLKHSTVNPKAFPEKGLYMLATILKGPKALNATLAVIETFTKVRELSRAIHELPLAQDKMTQKALMRKSGEIMTDMFGDDLKTSDVETSLELNFAILKFRHTVKRNKQA